MNALMGLITAILMHYAQIHEVVLLVLVPQALAAMELLVQVIKIDLYFSGITIIPIPVQMTFM